MYKMVFDYHTHTTYSHGKGSIEDNVKAAISKGLREIAISDHGPGHLNYGMKHEDFPKMRAEIDALQKKYPQIKIYLSVEANIGESGLDITEEDKKYCDFILAGYHYGIKDGHCMANWLYKHGIKGLKEGESLCEKNTQMVLRVLEKNDIKILTHPGDKGPFDIARIAAACAKKGVWMEISTHHDHLTPAEIEIAMKEDVKFIISSDAHFPEKVADYELGIQKAELAGLDLGRIVNIER